MIVSPKSGSHWYLPGPAGGEAKPFYEVPNKSKPGTMRSPTIRDARKVGAVPSVTTILRVLAKPGLEAWKQEQAILSALTLPRIAGESTDAFAARVVEDMEAQSEKAKGTGIAIHDAIENWIVNGAELMETAPEFPALCAYKTWHNTHILRVLHSEFMFAGPRYGGRIDLEATMKDDGATAIIDFKTQSTVHGKFKTYDEHQLQLIAYADGRGLSNARLINVILSTTEPGMISVHEWTPGRDEIRLYWNHVLSIWRIQNHMDD